MLSLDTAQKEFSPEVVYVNTASIGLPSRRTLEALDDATAAWRAGNAEAAGYDEAIPRARERFAALPGMIDGLRRQDFELVTVSELLGDVPAS